jgi:hypothetical protein
MDATENATRTTRHGPIRILLLIVVLQATAGCSVFRPRIPQPAWDDGSMSAAIAAIDTAYKSADDRVDSVTGINAISGVTTLVGTGGAGIAAVFSGSKDLILSFATLGAVALAVNGSYGNRVQSTIYQNASSALLCLSDTVAPIRGVHKALETQMRDVNEHRANVMSLLPQGSAGQQTLAQELIHYANEASDRHRARLIKEDAYAAKVLGTLRSLIDSANAQIQAAMPDAAALARTGNSLGEIRIKGEDTSDIPGEVEAPAAGTARAQVYRRNIQGTVAVDSPALQTAMRKLQLALNDAAENLGKDVATPEINCALPNAPTFAPLKVNIPAGQTAIPVGFGTVATFTISGGSPPYTQPRWIGAAPAFLEVVVESPDVLRISKTATAKESDFNPALTFYFDIYDSLGKHLDTPVQISVLKSP